MSSDIAKAAAREYLKEIDGEDFGTPDGHSVEHLAAVIDSALKRSQGALTAFQDTVWRSLNDYSKQLGWCLTGSQPECWVCLDAAVKELVDRRKVLSSSWQVVVEDEGQKSYPIGSCYDSHESAKYYRDICLEPRRGKRRYGFSKRVKFKIYRMDTVRTEEVG